MKVKQVMNSGEIREWNLNGNKLDYSNNGKIIDTTVMTTADIESFKDWADEEADMGALEIVLF